MVLWPLSWRNTHETIWTNIFGLQFGNTNKGSVDFCLDLWKAPHVMGTWVKHRLTLTNPSDHCFNPPICLLSFGIFAWLGVVRVSLADMDRETRENYTVLIQAKDMGGQMGGLAGTTTVSIMLSDVNDNPPMFEQSKKQQKLPASVPTLFCYKNRVIYPQTSSSVLFPLCLGTGLLHYFWFSPLLPVYHASVVRLLGWC